MPSSWKPKFIQLPIDKMAGASWNLLDHRGFRIALCGTDGNHEKDGELIANDLLNLIAIGEAVGELHEEAERRIAELEAENARLREAVLESWKQEVRPEQDGALTGYWCMHCGSMVFDLESEIKHKPDCIVEKVKDGKE